MPEKMQARCWMAKRNIPIFSEVKTAFESIPDIRYCIIGIATVGGILPKSFNPIMEDCISKKMNIVNGLHEYLSDIPELVLLARQYQVELIDVRKPKIKRPSFLDRRNLFC